jgi:hypothetical protein
MTPLCLFAVTSGWDGPFQLGEVVVAAETAEAALTHAEAAFGEANQPICRAKMRIAELGEVTEGAVIGPREAGTSLGAGGRALERRCDPEGAPRPS